MHDWIALDGLKSDVVTGLTVMEYTAPLIPPRKREETVLPGRLTAIQQRAWQQEPVDIPISLAIQGADQGEVYARWRSAIHWLYNAERLTVSTDPDRHYLGSVTQAIIEEETDKWIRLGVIFRANPPCPLKWITPAAGWLPVKGQPIPPQITEQNASASGHFMGNGWLGEPYQGIESAVLYLVITGTWTRLQLGSLTIHGVAFPATVYVDGENAQVWKMDGATEVNMMGLTSGDMPTLYFSQRLGIGGENVQADIRMLVLQRQ